MVVRNGGMIVKVNKMRNIGKRYVDVMVLKQIRIMWGGSMSIYTGWSKMKREGKHLNMVCESWHLYKDHIGDNDGCPSVGCKYGAIFKDGKTLQDPEQASMIWIHATAS